MKKTDPIKQIQAQLPVKTDFINCRECKARFSIPKLAPYHVACPHCGTVMNISAWRS